MGKNRISSYDQGGPTLDQRFESYYNYCNLFNYILSKFSVNLAKFHSITSIEEQQPEEEF